MNRISRRRFLKIAGFGAGAAALLLKIAES